MTQRKSIAHQALISVVDEKLSSMPGGANVTNLSDEVRVGMLKRTFFIKSDPVEVEYSEVRMSFDCPRCESSQTTWPDDSCDNEGQCENCEFWFTIANPIPRGSK